MSVISVIAGLLFIAGFIPYIYAILKGKAKPVKATWIIWAIIDVITFLGMYHENALNGQITGAVAGAGIVTLLSFKYGLPGWSKIDKFCLIGAIIAITLWIVFDNPVLGIITSCSAGFIGSIPTFVSAWENPDRESKAGWTLFWLSCVFAMIAIPEWTLADATAPITFSLAETIMMYILFIRPFFLKKGN